MPSYLFALVIFFAISVLSGCSAVGFNKPSALQVASTPEASVFLDGKHLGKTPFYSDQLKEGEYTLKITVSEASFIDKVNLSAGTLTVVNRDLNNNYLAQSGEKLSLVDKEKGLFIISNVSEADVIIDGSYAGKTPYLSRDMEAGDHKVQVLKEGYNEREFAIKASTNYQVLAEVTLASKVAKEIITSNKQALQLETQLVLILATPQNFLRVREEPSLTSVELGRVNPGDELILLQEQDDWYQISFEGRPGWISSTYAEKLE